MTMKQRKVAFEVETQFIADGVLQKTPVVGARSHEMTLRDGDEVRLRMKLPDCSKALGKLVKRQRVTVFFNGEDVLHDEMDVTHLSCIRRTFAVFNGRRVLLSEHDEDLVWFADGDTLELSYVLNVNKAAVRLLLA